MVSGWRPLVSSSVSHVGKDVVEMPLKFRIEQGAKVSAHYRSSSASLEPLHAEFGQSIQNVHADLTQEGAVTQLFADASTAFGPVQVIIVNHGYWPPEDVPIARMALAQWNATVSTDLTSSFLVVRAYLNGLERADAATKSKAAIVLIGSTAGKYGEAGHADYAACKSGKPPRDVMCAYTGYLMGRFAAMMYGLTMSLKNEIVKIAPSGRVNCVAPGWVRTPMATSALEDPRVVYQALATYVRRRSSFRRSLTARGSQHTTEKGCRARGHCVSDRYPVIGRCIRPCHWPSRHG